MIDRNMSIDTVFLIRFFRLGNWLFSKKRGNILYFIFYIFIRFVYQILQILYGCSIPLSTNIGKNICFKHGFHGIFISSKAIIGDNVIIMHQVTIGSNYTSKGEIFAPKIGNNVFIGPGVKIIGNSIIHDNSKIGANALVVNKECKSGVYVSKQSECIKQI